jgi:hypothetical protein
LREPKPTPEIAPEISPQKSGGGAIPEVAPDSPKKKS